MVMLVAHTKTKMGNSCLHDNVVPVVKFSVMLFNSDEFELKIPVLSQAELKSFRAKLGTSIFELKPNWIFF